MEQLPQRSPIVSQTAAPSPDTRSQAMVTVTDETNKHTVYNSSLGSVALRNFMAGFFRATGAIFVYGLFLTATGYVFVSQIYPEIKPYLDTFQELAQSQLEMQEMLDNVSTQSTQSPQQPAALKLTPEEAQRILENYNQPTSEQ